MLAATVLLTGRARLILDDVTESFRNDFREMLYLPRGKGLKVLACGFDTPLADALFIKSLIYFGESMQALGTSAARRAYTYDLYDVITDLSPRFYRAYQVGALFLTASKSIETNKQGILLLDKGIAYFDKITSEGESLRPDPRWLLHLLLANTYEINIQGRLRNQGDNIGAREARDLASREFQLAAKSPGAPEFVLLAATGYESVRSGKGKVDDSAKAMLAIWRDLHDQAASKGDKEVQAVLENHIKETETFLDTIAETRAIERILNQVSHVYMARHKSPPTRLTDLVREKLLSKIPVSPLSKENETDTWLPMPDGTFKSMALAKLEKNSHIDLLSDAIIAYMRANSQPPPDLQTLVNEKILENIPVPPLAAIGQIYEYDAKSGTITDKMPYGPLPPP